MIWAIIELCINNENRTIYADIGYKYYIIQLFGKINA